MMPKRARLDQAVEVKILHCFSQRYVTPKFQNLFVDIILPFIPTELLKVIVLFIPKVIFLFIINLYEMLQTKKL